MHCVFLCKACEMERKVWIRTPVGRQGLLLSVSPLQLITEHAMQGVLTLRSGQEHNGLSEVQGSTSSYTHTRVKLEKATHPRESQQQRWANAVRFQSCNTVKGDPMEIRNWAVSWTSLVGVHALIYFTAAMQIFGVCLGSCLTRTPSSCSICF